AFEIVHDVREALRKFVDEQMSPGDLVAIIRTGAGIGALQQFTGDKRLLYAAIERVRYNLNSRSGVSTFLPADEVPVVNTARGSDNRLDEVIASVRGGQRSDETNPVAGVNEFREVNSFREEIFAVGTLGALNFVVRGMRELPGRKAVILFSDGFRLYEPNSNNPLGSDYFRVRENMRRLIDLSNRSSVVFYTIDARGVAVTFPTAGDNLSGAITSGDRNAANAGDETYREFGDRIGGLNESRRSDLYAKQEGLSYLAQETGGIFIRNTNDISGATQRAIDDSKSYYLLGYRPDDGTFSGDPNRFHSITVKVRRPGLRVRSRTGFYGVTNSDARPVRTTPTQQLVAALASPFASAGIRLRMNSLFGYDTQKGAFAQSLIYIDSHDINFLPDTNGQMRAAIDIMAVTFGDDGRVIDQSIRAYTIRVFPEQLQRNIEAGLIYIITLPIKKPGAYQLRIAVRDKDTQRVGSANQFIEVPNVKKGNLTLSGVTVRGVDGANAQRMNVGQVNGALPGTADGAAPVSDYGANTAVRRFRRGMTLEYAYYIYNARTQKTVNRPQLATQMRLFRDGQQVYAGPVRSFDGGGQTDLKQLIGGGRLQLGKELQPGEYILQVLVTDEHASGRNRTTSQWADFEIVK
ncbi:MAG: VWA domain-containing protein, partial [Pyrinomonadaceae bacterium]|nr:VWA domain-containing protein [Pyrinomonadaceae bacterium]